MSRNRKDYTKYIRTPIEEHAVITEASPEVTEINEEPVAAPKIGIVTDCSKLNVREEPSAKSAIVCVVDCSTDLMIEDERSTEDFYKVYTATGVEGYCMKRFITIKP